MSAVTRILAALEQADSQAANHFLPLVNGELRKLAAEQMASERPGHTLTRTALVNEAYVWLVDVKQAQHWNSRGGFWRYFAGMALDQAATALGVSRARAYRHWSYARVWLRSELLKNALRPEDFSSFVRKLVGERRTG